MTSKTSNHESIMTIEMQIKNLPEKQLLFLLRTGSYFDSAPLAWSDLMKYVKAKSLVEFLINEVLIIKENIKIKVINFITSSNPNFLFLISN